MLALSLMGTLVAIAVIATSLLLIGLVLLQKNRGSGLSGAFGGVGGHSAFGTKTGDVLTWITVGLAALFLGLNIAGNYMFREADVDASNSGAGVAETTSETPGDAAPAGATPKPNPAGAAKPLPKPKPIAPIKTTPKPAGQPVKPAGG